VTKKGVVANSANLNATQAGPKGLLFYSKRTKQRNPAEFLTGRGFF